MKKNILLSILAIAISSCATNKFAHTSCNQLSTLAAKGADHTDPIDLDQMLDRAKELQCKLNMSMCPSLGNYWDKEKKEMLPSKMFKGSQTIKTIDDLEKINDKYQCRLHINEASYKCTYVDRAWNKLQKDLNTNELSGVYIKRNILSLQKLNEDNDCKLDIKLERLQSQCDDVIYQAKETADGRKNCHVHIPEAIQLRNLDS